MRGEVRSSSRCRRHEDLARENGLVAAHHEFLEDLASGGVVSEFCSLRLLLQSDARKEGPPSFPSHAH